MSNSETFEKWRVFIMKKIVDYFFEDDELDLVWAYGYLLILEVILILIIILELMFYKIFII